jgi:arabinosyltransferase C
VIAAGAIPSALWFLYVLQRDSVFQARAATPTYAANFRQVVFGYLGLMLLGLVALAVRPGSSRPQRVCRAGGMALLAILFLGMFVAAGDHPASNTYFMSLGIWIGCLGLCLIAIALVSDENPAWNLAASWAVLGTLAPYFPELFQRKLSMGLAVPWAILAALAIGTVTRKLDRSTRNLVLVLSICLLGATSIRWFAREFELAKRGVSNTTMHPVYLGIDETQILKQLNDLGGQRTVVLAMPGVNLPDPTDPDPNNPSSFIAPYLPDLNPILSGMTGVYTYAGHWSETPDYLQRRALESNFFRSGTSDAWRIAFLKQTGADYIVAPAPQAFPFLPIDDVSKYGEVVYSGVSDDKFRLVRVR